MPACKRTAAEAEVDCAGIEGTIVSSATSTSNHTRESTTRPPNAAPLRTDIG